MAYTRKELHAFICHNYTCTKLCNCYKLLSSVFVKVVLYNSQFFATQRVLQKETSFCCASLSLDYLTSQISRENNLHAAIFLYTLFLFYCPVNSLP